MKHLQIPTIAAVVLVGCGDSQEVKDKMLGEAAHSMKK